MHSRVKNKNRIKSHHRHSRVVLERLTPRLLLNATCEWADHEDFDDFLRPGYGIPDAYYSDPSTWPMAEHDLLSGYKSDLIDPDDSSAFSALFNVPDSESAIAVDASVLYLEFDGDRVFSRPGDFWLGSSSIDIPAYNLDMFGWAGRELESISYITQFVREDYAAFNVFVTDTKPVSGEYSTIYVGGTNDWFRPDSGVIGVATYDVGNRIESSYGFAFSEELSIYRNYSGGSLLNFSEYLANLITHEAAHTFGSNHVSDTSATMNPYLAIRPRSTSFGRDDSQDTQTLLASNLGYAHGRDDYGDDIYTAQSINSYGIVEGLLERRDDSDAFTFTAATSGIMTVDLDTTIYGNLDSSLTVLRNQDQATIAYNDDYYGQEDSFLSFSVSAGEQYSLLLCSSEHNSSGTYTLNLTAPPDAPVIAVSEDSGSVDDLAVEFQTIMAGDSDSEVITITNTGSDDLLISELISDGGFELDIVSLPGYDSDDIVLSAGEVLDVTVTFEPDLAGLYSGTVTILSNDIEQSSIVIELGATAVQPQPNLIVLAGGEQLTDNTVDIGSILRDATGTETILIRNNGFVDLLISDINITELFTLIDDFSDSTIIIQPNQSIELTVNATASSRGSFDGQVTITSNDPDQPISTTDLTVNVVGGVLSLTDSSQLDNDHRIDFGTVYTGENASRTITLTNTGDAELCITGMTMDGDFSLDALLDQDKSDDDITLAIGESMIVTVGYSPDEWEEVAGTITITTDNCETPVTNVELYALGRTDALEIAELDGSADGSIDAGEIWLKRNQNIPTWRLTNHGSDPLTISLSLSSGTDFQLAGPETIIITAGQSYTVDLVLSTELACAVAGELTLSADDFHASTQTIAVSASPYALVGSGRSYSFTDHSGDRVTISLIGSTMAKVELGTGDRPDIESIELLSSGSGRDGLTRAVSAGLIINVAGEGTQLGSLVGNCDLGIVIARNVEIVGSGIDLDGSLGMLLLGGLGEGASINCSADAPALLMIQKITGNSSINIDGPLRMLLSDDLADASLSAKSISLLMLGRLDGDVNVTDGRLDNLIVRNGNLDGSINVNGQLGSLNIINGDLLGDLNVENDISSIILPRGTITGAVRSGGTIGNIFAADIDRADIFALNKIDRINVLADLGVNSKSVRSNYNLDEFLINGS